MRASHPNGPIRSSPVALRLEVEYLDHLRIERGLAESTLSAYGRDVARLRAHAARRRRDMASLGQRDLADFIAGLGSEGLGPRSVARGGRGGGGLVPPAVSEGR